MNSSLSTKNQNLKVEQVDINKLRPSEYNPRSISDTQLEHLGQSLDEHGFVHPILANSNPKRAFIVVSGHQRLRVAKQRGFKTVPTIFINVDEKQERLLKLRSNRIGGEFDNELLFQHFDINTLLKTGFDDIDLGDIWNASLDIDDDDFDQEKAIKKASTTKIKLGDRFELGKHSLICGDATDSAVIKQLVGNLKPAMLYTDPVYNISLDYDKGVGNKASYGGKANDTKTDAEYADFLSAALTNGLAVMGEDAHIFMYCDQTYIGLLQNLMSQHGLTNRRVCLWIKNGFSPVPGVAFNKGYEACVYATRGTPYLSDIHNLTEILNKDIASGNRAIDDIIDIFDIWLAKRDPGQAYQHPTQKPLTLHEKPLKRCTRIGDIVLDYYGGSGSTLLACEQMNRVALLCEIEPVFCQVVIDRYELLSGEKAIKL
jgi:DNA modification methylase